ncbi:MAG: hypothetical protein ACJAZ9_000331 [Neolewinella sp.]|jgi:hypothetical protein
MLEGKRKEDGEKRQNAAPPEICDFDMQDAIGYRKDIRCAR